MQIIDAHQHLGNDPYQKEKLGEYISFLQNKNAKNSIHKAIVTIFPHTPAMFCQHNERHVVQVVCDAGIYNIKCRECHFSSTAPISPYMHENLEFLQLSKAYDWVIPYAVMVVSNNLGEELRLLQEAAPWLAGIKLYTGYSGMILNEIKKIDCHLPLLIHTGIYPNQNLESMMQFIINYDGPVQVAHFGRFDVKNISVLAEYDNVFFDCAPANYLYQNQTQKLCVSGFKSIDEMFYRMIDLVGIEKLAWGSDIPFGDVVQELELVNRLSLSSTEREKLLYKNIKDRLKIA